MAIEKFINGKHDDGHHEGKASEIRRILEAEDMIRELWPEFYEAALKGKLELEDDFHPHDDRKKTSSK